MSWKELEDRVKNLLRSDKAKTVPGSGNGKSEEDVIGLSTISQCKYSTKKNITILRKDLDRLVSACNQQEKLPLFFTENDGVLLLSIPENHIIGEIIDIIIAISLLEKTLNELEECDTIKRYNILSSFIQKDLQPVVGKARTLIDERNIRIKKKLEILFNDLTTHDLFDTV